MQIYRLYPAFFTQEFPVLYSGNGQERHQQIPVQLTAPIALPNTQTRFTVVFVHSLKGDFAGAWQSYKKACKERCWKRD